MASGLLGEATGRHFDNRKPYITVPEIAAHTVPGSLMHALRIPEFVVGEAIQHFLKCFVVFDKDRNSNIVYIYCREAISCFLM
jgi:hypothetical protein